MCSTFILPLILPVPLYFLYEGLGYLFSYKKCDRYFPKNMDRSFMAPYCIFLIFTFINFIVRVEHSAITVFENFNKLNTSLEFQGWFLDYKGVLLLSIIIYTKFQILNRNLYNLTDDLLALFLFVTFPDSLIVLNIFRLYIHRNYRKNKSITFTILYSLIGLYQLYNWSKIVNYYDLINNKCYLDGFIDISTPEKLYITMLMIITYGLQTLLFWKTIGNELIVYILSVIAFSNGTIALSIYIILYENLM